MADVTQLSDEELLAQLFQYESTGKEPHGRSLIGRLHPAPFGPALEEYPRVAAEIASGVTLGLVKPETFLGGKEHAKKFAPVSSLRGRATSLVGSVGVPSLPLMRGAKWLGRTPVGQAIKQELPGFLRGIPAAVSEAKLTNLAGRTREGLVGAMGRAGEALEEKLGTLTGNVDLSQRLTELKNALAANPELHGLVQEGIEKARRVGDMTLETLLADPSKATSLTPQQAQQVLATLKQSRQVGRSMERLGRFPGQGGKFLRETSEAELDLLAHHHQILNDATASLPKEFGQAREEFAKTAQSARDVKPLFSKRGLEKNIRSGFESGEMRRSVARVLPPDLAKETLGVHSARKLGKFLAITGGSLTGLGAVAASMKHRPPLRIFQNTGSNQ